MTQKTVEVSILTFVDTFERYGFLDYYWKKFLEFCHHRRGHPDSSEESVILWDQIIDHLENETELSVSFLHDKTSTVFNVSSFVISEFDWKTLEGWLEVLDQIRTTFIKYDDVSSVDLSWEDSFHDFYDHILDPLILGVLTKNDSRF